LEGPLELTLWENVERDLSTDRVSEVEAGKFFLQGFDESGSAFGLLVPGLEFVSFLVTVRGRLLLFSGLSKVREAATLTRRFVQQGRR
jgi:hypothetical protein